jgi:hypothetical protein
MTDLMTTLLGTVIFFKPEVTDAVKERTINKFGLAFDEENVGFWAYPPFVRRIQTSRNKFKNWTL